MATAAILSGLIACGGENGQDVLEDNGTTEVSQDTGTDTAADVPDQADTGSDERPTTDTNSDVQVGDAGDVPSELNVDIPQDLDDDDAGLDAAPDAVDAVDAVPDEGPADTYVPPTIPEGSDFTATGFFHVQTNDGRWWIVDPEGNPFYSIGINACTANGSVDASNGKNRYNDAVKANYANYDEWAETTVERLQSWGFNTAGAWSDPNLLGTRMPYALILNISGVDWLVGEIPDYFSSEFAARCAEVARTQVAARKDDPKLIGWFLDNELRWGWDWRSPWTLLQDYLAMPETTPGRKIAEAYRGDPTGFLKAVASQYFFVTTTAVRAADPNHMILGIRSISVMTHPEVPEAAGPWVDIYSVNNYTFMPELYDAIDGAGQIFMDESNWLVNYYKATGRPIMVTEFSFRSSESDVPNTTPIFYPTLPTQTERADAYAEYARNCFAKPYIVGHHWFQWADEPAGGRFDGENSNFGLVDGDDVPYLTLTETMTSVNAGAPGRL